jgi:hypothetical protein
MIPISVISVAVVNMLELYRQLLQDEVLHSHFLSEGNEVQRFTISEGHPFRKVLQEYRGRGPFSGAIACSGMLQASVREDNQEVG